MKSIKCANFNEIEAIEVSVEVTFTKGLPSFTIVGLATNSIQESKDRVKSALLTNDFKFPPKKITINMAPSEIKKSGTHFDLAISLLISLYEEKNIDFKTFHIFGELSLDGQIQDCSSIFPIILSLAKQNLIKNVLVSNESAKKISQIPNIKIYCVDNINQAIEFFKSNKKDDFLYKKAIINHQKININGKDFFYQNIYDLDFNEVKGQEFAKRAMLICAAGNHNIILEGSPGVGKSMIAKRLPYIMPPMSLDEILEIAKLQCLELKEPDFKPIRSFRSPHNTSTKASIVGGTNIGEIGLANSGILFFDELPHFTSSIIEALREPLEDYRLLVSRSKSKIIYETKFLFIGAQNPCPCGNLLSKKSSCRCNELEIKRYKSRLSEPFLDRIDLYVIMNDTSEDNNSTISSKEIHEKVIDAFKMQKLRNQKELNGKLSDLEISKYCSLDDECKGLLEKARMNLDLSYRSINKILKVARTIADLDSNSEIQKSHLLESLSYRRR